MLIKKKKMEASGYLLQSRLEDVKKENRRANHAVKWVRKREKRKVSKEG